MSYFEEHGVDAHETHHQPENSILVPAEMAELLEGMGANANAKRARQSWMDELESLSLASLDAEDACPVCFKTFGALVTEEEHGLAVESPAYSPATLGACQLPCKHYLCRRCVSEWLSSHNDCPSCRAQCDPEPTTVSAALLPEVGDLPRLLEQMASAQHQGGGTADADLDDADGGIARTLGGRPPVRARDQEREEFSMYS